MGAIAGLSEKCIEKFQKALALLQKYAPSKKRKIAQVCSMIGAEHERNRNYSAANKFYEDSVGTMKSVFGPFHLDIAENLINLSRVKSALSGEKRNKSLYCEHNAQATDCFEEAIDIQKSRLGNCEETAITLTVFGAHLASIGDYKKAELAFSSAISILKEQEGEQKPSLAKALLGIADLMTITSKYDDAMDLYAQCLKIQQAAFGKEHGDIALTLYSMGLARLDEGVYSSALILFAKSLYMRIELHGKSHPTVGDTYDIMGFVEAKNGDLENAQLRLNNALKVRKLLRDRLKEADTLSNIGNLHRERNEFDLALQRYNDCLKIRIFELGRNNPSVADAFVALGNVQSDMDNPEEALSYYREALQIVISTKGSVDAAVALIFKKVGMVQFRAGNLESGYLYLEKAVEIYRQRGKGYESELITPLFIIGNIHKILKQTEEAQRAWSDAFQMSKAIRDYTNQEVHLVLTRLLKVQ